MTAKQEKRAAKREPVSGAVEYSIQGEVIKTFRGGQSIDMSESGMGIVSDCSLEPGQVIIFKDKDNPPVIKIAIVQWSMKVGDIFRAGLRFI